MNTFGHIYRLTDFGESHGPAMGGVIDGVPPRFHLDMEMIKEELRKRSTGTSHLVSQRKEPDEVIFLSGINEEGFTLGTPIGFIIKNHDAKSADYSSLQHTFRPNHADYTYMLRYGIRDYRGGGRASARETVSRMVAGAIAMQLLHAKGITIHAHISQIGPISSNGETELTAEMKQLIEQCISSGNSVGGIVKVTVKGMPGGVGNPVFGKVQSQLGSAMMSINAVRGFQFGDGFNAASSYGADILDIYTEASTDNGKLTLASSTNHNGGLLGGITTGADIEFDVAFKPTPSIRRPIATFTDRGEATTLHIQGRHDPCVALRGLHVVRAMTAMVMLDALLLQNAYSL